MNVARAITDYLRSSKAELEKVSWPSRQQTVRYSTLVMGVSIVVALFFATLDFGLGKIVDAALTGGSTATEAPAAPVVPDVDVAPSVPGLDIQGEGATVIPES